MRRPNILILTTDQQRWDALGANGNRQIQTPNLDRLAADGVNFDHHYVQNPVCMPSRVSFLTGQYPSKLGITHMAVPVPEGTITLPRMLRNYGYYSANIGKLHFLPHADRDHRENHPDYGFDHLEISDEPGCYEDAYRAWARLKDPSQMDHLSVGLPPATETWLRSMGLADTVRHPKERFEKRPIAFPGRSDMTHSAFVAEQTMQFLAEHGDRPFLCVAGFYSPHAPWVAPQEYLDLYDPAELDLPEFPEEINAQRQGGHFDDEELAGARQGYYAMVSEVDHHVGRILARLAELDLADDTIVVFTSDHGEWLGEHLRYGKGYPAHDCVSGVPLIIRYGRRIDRPGRTIDGIVEAVDVVPTLLEWAGVQVPYHIQGRSLAPMIEGTDETGRRSALTEVTGSKILRIPGLRYVCHDDGREFLYDLEKEFGEYHNVSGEAAYASDLSDARAELLRHLLEIERPIPRTWQY